jgi:hypothetical protein
VIEVSVQQGGMATQYAHFCAHIQSICDAQKTWHQKLIWNGTIITKGLQFDPSLDVVALVTGFREQNAILFRSEGLQRAYDKELKKESRVYFRCVARYRKRKRTASTKQMTTMRSVDPLCSCDFKLALKKEENKGWEVVSFTDVHTYHFSYNSDNAITRRNQLPLSIVNECRHLFIALVPTIYIRQLLLQKGFCVTKKFIQNFRRDSLQKGSMGGSVSLPLWKEPMSKNKQSQTLQLVKSLQLANEPFVIRFQVCQCVFVCECVNF